VDIIFRRYISLRSVNANLQYVYVQTREQKEELLLNFCRLKWQSVVIVQFNEATSYQFYDFEC